MIDPFHLLTLKGKPQPKRRRPLNRHTMGNDWGGRNASNPSDAPKVTKQDVERAAEIKGVKVRREGPSAMWWVWEDAYENRRTLGMTNYLALRNLAQRPDKLLT